MLPGIALFALMATAFSRLQASPLITIYLCYGRDHQHEFLSLYLHHGERSISRAMINFHWLQPSLLAWCPAPGLHQEDE
jgi:hypothetical protein